MNAIRQRKGFESRAYSLDPDSEFIEVEWKTIKEKLRYRIHLSEIGNEIEYEADNVLLAKIFFSLSGLIAIFCLGYYYLGNPENPGAYVVGTFSCGIIALCGVFMSYKDDLIITNGSKLIALYRDKPNEEKALEFAQFLISKANDKKREMLINFELPEEQFLSNIHWLHTVKMIERTELEELQKEYRLKKLL